MTRIQRQEDHPYFVNDTSVLAIYHNLLTICSVGMIMSHTSRLTVVTCVIRCKNLRKQYHDPAAAMAPHSIAETT
jgi:hypothetical protein